MTVTATAQTKGATALLAESLSRCLAAPFDAMRVAYGNAVQLGLAPRSMLVSRDIEKTLAALERVTLGPWARRT